MKALRLTLARSRWLWPALLALCVMAKPILDLVGELHRDLHALTHVETVDIGLSSANEAAEQAEHAPPEGWHALMHLDPCCCVSALPVVGFVAVAAPPRAFIGRDPPLLAPANPRNDPLRPPIVV